MMVVAFHGLVTCSGITYVKVKRHESSFSLPLKRCLFGYVIHIHHLITSEHLTPLPKFLTCEKRFKKREETLLARLGRLLPTG